MELESIDKFSRDRAPKKATARETFSDWAFNHPANKDEALGNKSDMYFTIDNEQIAALYEYLHLLGSYHGSHHEPVPGWKKTKKNKVYKEWERVKTKLQKLGQL